MSLTLLNDNELYHLYLDSIFDVNEQSCIPKSFVGLDPKVCHVCQVTGDARGHVRGHVRDDVKGHSAFVEMKCKTTAVGGTDGSTFKKAKEKISF